MKRYTSCLLFILLLSFLIIDAASQRGGGGRSRSSFSSSRRSSWGRSSSWGSSSSTPSKPMTWSQIFWSLSVLGGFFGAFYLCSAYINKGGNLFESRKDKIKKVTDQFQGRNQGNMCTLSQQERNRTIDWFMSKQWKIMWRMRDGYTQGQYNFRVKDIVKRTDYVYEIQAEGSEYDLGDSVIRGIILFQATYLTICFDKQYNNKSRAGQTGKWDILVYQGIQQGQTFVGEWYYQNYKYDSQYSGEMRMINS